MSNPTSIDPFLPFFDTINSYLRFSHSTAQRLIDAATVKVVNVGGRVQIRRSEILRLQGELMNKTVAA